MVDGRVRSGSGATVNWELKTDCLYVLLGVPPLSLSLSLSLAGQAASHSGKREGYESKRSTQSKGSFLFSYSLSSIIVYKGAVL